MRKRAKGKPCTSLITIVFERTCSYPRTALVMATASGKKHGIVGKDNGRRDYDLPEYLLISFEFISCRYGTYYEKHLEINSGVFDFLLFAKQKMTPAVW